MAKTDKTPLLEKDQKKQINELQKSTRELQDQLHDAIEKALNQDGELHKLRKSATELKANSKRFFKKSRQTRVSQMGCCAYSCLLLKEFFTSLLLCLKRLCCCIEAPDYPCTAWCAS
jgi:hypothetical protein